mgnify:CR=1 FL=1
MFLFKAPPTGRASVRPGSPEAEVLLNGVKLGAEPAPILHGDKLQVGPHELLVTDPRRSGSTQFVQYRATWPRSSGQFKSGAPKPATAATGGRSRLSDRRTGVHHRLRADGLWS